LSAFARGRNGQELEYEHSESSAESVNGTSLTAWIRRHPVFAFFAVAYVIPAVGFLVVVGPKLLHGAELQSTDALILFPVMELGVCLAGVGGSGITNGRNGPRRLGVRIRHWCVGARWYLPLLIPPIAILFVLLALGIFLSPDFAPQIFPFGILFGLLAGLFGGDGMDGLCLPEGSALRAEPSAPR